MGTSLAPKLGRRKSQRTLDQARKPTGWGGWRPGAGRKPTGKRVGPMHRERPEMTARHPLHVVLHALPEVGRLRRPPTYHAIREALELALARGDFRVVAVSVQHNHVHLVVEADDRRALSSGLRGLSISMSRRINQALARKGKALAHRYSVTPITSPPQARAVLAYVLNNWRHHQEDERTAEARRSPVDPYSSGPTFDGWRDLPADLGLPADYQPLPAARPHTWILRLGWRRHGLLSVREQPGPTAEVAGATDVAEMA